jgi:NDP-sugar pyrophosphorylase family protein
MTRITNFVFPMAGAGSRFKKNGYETPKPLLQLHGRYFFEIAARNLIDQTDSFSLSFIVLREHCDLFQIDSIIKNVFPLSSVDILALPTCGAAETTYLGLQNLQLRNGSLVVADCDQWLSGRKLSTMFKGLQQEVFDIAVPYFYSENPSYSYLTHNREGKVDNIIEKMAISKNAVAGCYGFRDVELFLRIYDDQKKWGVEKYLSDIIARALASNLDVRSFELESHVPFGTPTEYQSAVRHEGLVGQIDAW